MGVCWWVTIPRASTLGCAGESPFPELRHWGVLVSHHSQSFDIGGVCWWVVCASRWPGRRGIRGEDKG